MPPRARSPLTHRRTAAAVFAAVLLAVAATGRAADPPATRPTAASGRPNILFILCDDHAFGAIGAYGSVVNRTPNIDRIATEGVRFDRCLTTYSLCGPSRATILTGKYAHLNGFYNNHTSRFDGSQPTFPKLLQAAGYQTALVGKWHLVTDPTGFDFWEVLPGQGRYYNPELIRLGRKGVRPGYVTDVITDDAVDWLAHRDASKPFLLMVGHKAPHRSWEPALANLALYDGVTFPAPPTLFDDYAGRGKAERQQQQEIAKYLTDSDLKLTPPGALTPAQRKVWDAYYEPRNRAFLARHLSGEDLVRWKYQRFLHDYVATVASVDQSTGRLLKYLSDAGLDRNTIVVYSSDQGVFLGEHGWFDKRWIFEQSLRTPLLVRWPGVVAPGRTNADLVSNLDFAQTFLDAAGVPQPPDVQGRSLVPILRGTTPPDWRTDFYYHYYEHPAEHNVARQYGVVTDRYKLVHFYDPDMNYWELFDLRSDPLELKSVYGDPTYAADQADLHRRLDRLRHDLRVPDPDPPQSGTGLTKSPFPWP